MKHNPSYYRARLKAIADELYLGMLDDRSKQILQNGYFPDWESEYPVNPDTSDAPLTFLEVCSWDTFFTMFPEKVCGETVVTTSREFPLEVKATRDDVIRTVTKGIEIARRIREITPMMEQLSKKMKKLSL